MKATFRDDADRETGAVVRARDALDAPCAGDPDETMSGALAWIGDLVVAEDPGTRRGRPEAPKPKTGRLRGAFDALRGKD